MSPGCNFRHYTAKGLMNLGLRNKASRDELTTVLHQSAGGFVAASLNSKVKQEEIPSDTTLATLAQTAKGSL